MLARRMPQRARRRPNWSRSSTTSCARWCTRSIRLTPNIVEVVVRAPMAARAFQPGQFYRLQNYETLAPRVDGTTLAMEGLALTGASVDREKGLLSTIVLEMGGSSDLCALLKPGEPVILMGPTGTPTETPAERDGAAGRRRARQRRAVLDRPAACARSGSRVLYFAGYKKIIDRYKVEEIEKAADVVVWCCDEAPGFTPGRGRRTSAFVGNIVEAMAAYGTRRARRRRRSRSSAVDRLIVIGSDGMMGAVAQARHARARAAISSPAITRSAAINSPMQCMMKEICAQCLQLHKDPVTGEETVVFSCFNQDQPLDHVDFGSLRTRASPERRAGEADQAVDRPLPAATSAAAPPSRRSRCVFLCARARPCLCKCKSRSASS